MAELLTMGTVIISSELELKPIESTFVINFAGRTVERIKSKITGEYEPTSHFFYFEIWDSAAKFLYENAKKGDKIVVQATPRENKYVKDGKNISKVVFRINKFELCDFKPKALDAEKEVKRIEE